MSQEAFAVRAVDANAAHKPKELLGAFLSSQTFSVAIPMQCWFYCTLWAAQSKNWAVYGRDNTT
jgi:hypothetical protein